jgi:hypothetical protein
LSSCLVSTALECGGAYVKVPGGMSGSKRRERKHIAKISFHKDTRISPRVIAGQMQRRSDGVGLKMKIIRRSRSLQCLMSNVFDGDVS